MVAVVGIEVRPSEQDVAGRLHELLSAHDPLAGLSYPHGPAVRLEDRLGRLLELHEQWRAVVGLEQHDQAEGPDAADADHLVGDVDDSVAVDDGGPVRRERPPVAVEEIAQPVGVDRRRRSPSAARSAVVPKRFFGGRRRPR
jgi:hypothetical protein